MTPKTAGEIMRRARIRLRAGDVTHHQFAILDCLMWRCRRAGSDQCSVSLRRLSDLAHVAKETVVSAIARFEALGVLRKIKRRVRIAWAGGTASRQATNVYVFLAPNTESARSPVYGEQGQIQTVIGPVPAAAREAQAALEVVRLRRESAILAGLGKRPLWAANPA